VRALVRGVVAIAIALALACGDPADPLVEIRALQDAGRYQDTLEPLRRLIDADPGIPEAHHRLGVALLRTGEAGLAVWPLRKASESREYAVEAGLLLVQALLEGRSGPDAVAAADGVLAVEPENVNALALRMQANLVTGELEAGLGDIERVLELDPENVAVLVPRVTTLIALDRIDEAEAALEVARERIEASDEELAGDMQSRLCVAQGLFAFEKGDRDTAEERYAACLAEFENDPLVVAENAAFYDRLGEPDRATGIIQAAFDATQASVFRVALAQRMSALGRQDERERLLREEAQAQGSASAWFALADFLVEQERFDDAVAAFESALSASPSPSPMLRFAYADTLVQAGKYDAARRVARQLRQPELRSLIRGRLLLAEGDPRGALAAFESGIALWPNNATARYLAGRAAEQIGDFPRAVSEYRESIRASRGASEAGLALAPLHAAQEDWDGALDAARSYLATHPRDPDGLLASIRIAHRAGRDSIAKEALRRLSEIPGQAAVAAAEEAALLASGPEPDPAAAVRAIESRKLDLDDPANLPALRVLLDQLAAQGEYARAEARSAKALRKNPEHAAFHALAGRSAAAAGNPTAAKAAFERALALDASEGTALAGLARIAAESGDRAGAVAFYDRAAAAVGTGDESADPALAAALLLRDAGDIDAARARLERLLASHPREARAANALAELLVDRGDLDAARDFASRAAWFALPEAEATLARIEEARAAPRAE
jgi:tetratricopeptide (TPR) repeat protein